MKQTRYEISVTLPDDVTKAEFQEYMRQAIENWSGGGDPADPLFGWFHEGKRRLRIVSIPGRRRC